MARLLYDALRSGRARRSWEIDTGNGGYTHRLFHTRAAPTKLRQQRDAIAEWSRLTLLAGWARTGPSRPPSAAPSAPTRLLRAFEDNAKTWYKRIQEACLYPQPCHHQPADRPRQAGDRAKDVHLGGREKSTAASPSAAPGGRHEFALTHYNLVGQGSAQLLGDNTDFALMFIAPMNTPGMKLICRPLLRTGGGIAGSPFDYPLSSRLDENDAILVMDKVFIPGENVLPRLRALNSGSPPGWLGRLSPDAGLHPPGGQARFITGALYRVPAMHRLPGVPRACRRRSAKWWPGATCSGR